MPIVHFRDSSAHNGDAEKYEAKMRLQIAPNTNLSSSVRRELVVIHHIPKPPSPDLSIAHRERPGLSVLGFEVMYKLIKYLRRWPGACYPTYHHVSGTMLGAFLRELRADTRRVTDNYSHSYIPVKASAALYLPARVAHAILLMNEPRKRSPRDGQLCLICGGRAVFDNREDLSSFPDDERPVGLELGCKYQRGVGHWVVMGLSLIPGFGEGSSSKLCSRHVFHVQRMFHYLMYDSEVEERPRTPLDANKGRERYIGRILGNTGTLNADVSDADASEAGASEADSSLLSD